MGGKDREFCGKAGGGHEAAFCAESEAKSAPAAVQIPVQQQEKIKMPRRAAGAREACMKRIISYVIAKQIVAEIGRQGKRKPPIDGTRALVERQSWGKLIALSAKCFLLLPLKRLLLSQ